MLKQFTSKILAPFFNSSATDHAKDSVKAKLVHLKLVFSRKNVILSVSTDNKTSFLKERFSLFIIPSLTIRAIINAYVKKYTNDEFLRRKEITWNKIPLKISVFKAGSMSAIFLKLAPAFLKT